jgi:hypothetical protein
LRDLRLPDTDCERLVFRMRSSSRGNVLAASADELDELLGFVAAEANDETNRRHQRRLDAVFAALNEAPSDMESANTSPSLAAVAGRAKETGGDAGELIGRWRILETDLWDRDALDLVAPAFIEFFPDRTGRFGFIAVTGWMDCRSIAIGRSHVEFSWEGTDEGDQVSGRGWAAIQDDGLLHGHLHFHLGDDSGFRAERYKE